MTEFINEANADLYNLLYKIVVNQKAIACVCDTQLPYVITNDNIKTVLSTAKGQPQMVMPKSLETKMLNKQAFYKAIEAGYITISENGSLVWRLSNTLLAYFMGRLFAGDRSKLSARKKSNIWLRGKRMFPGTEIGRLFNVHTLKEIRMNRISKCVPENFQVVDNLFVTA